MALDYTLEVQGEYGEVGGAMLAGFLAHESALREAVNYVNVKKFKQCADNWDSIFDTNVKGSFLAWGICQRKSWLGRVYS